MLEYKATAIGAGRNVVMEYFEKEYREDMSLDDAIIKAMIAMGKAIESELTPEGVEVGIVRVEDKMFKLLSIEEIKPYVEKANEIIRAELKKR